MMAAALTGVLPVMIIFLFLQKYLVAGLTAGAVKEETRTKRERDL